MRFRLRDIDARAPHRPAGYKERVLAAGTIDGDEIEIPDEVYKALCDEFRNDGPTWLELFSNFARASAKWVLAGFPLVSEQVLKRRLGPKGCGVGLPEGERCPHFEPDAFAGAGRCRLCGCGSKLKAHMATEKCPDGRAGWA